MRRYVRGKRGLRITNASGRTYWHPTRRPRRKRARRG